MKPVSLCQKSQERPPIHENNSSKSQPRDLKMFQHHGNSGLGPLGPIGNIEKYGSYCQFLSKLFLVKIVFKSLY